MITINGTANANAIEILEYFSTKRHIAGLQNEGINFEIYNDLFRRGLLAFTNGKGEGLYIQTTADGNLILLALRSRPIEEVDLSAVKSRADKACLEANLKTPSVER